MPTSASTARETWLLGGIFLLALAYSLYGVTYHWTMGFLPGHEFRQAQTAITTYYIDRQDNFGLLYETPILGKPWVSLLLEVPVYEWAVVLLSRAAGVPHHVAARTVSAACFYLMLPAIYLLLGRLRLAKPRRLLVLALVLAAPVYIYYSRAFLMDSMALMFSAWFLLGFVRTMDERSRAWLALTVVAGTGAALVKSATLAVWLIPAAAYGAWLLWRDVRARTGWMVPLKTLLWGLATIVVALGALRGWIAYTDPIKDAHASAWIFSSKALTQSNWGLFDLKAIFSAQVWRFWLGCWEQAVMSRWAIAAGLLAGLALPAVRGRVLGLGALFLPRPVPLPLRVRLPGLLLLFLRGLRARGPGVYAGGPARCASRGLAGRIGPGGPAGRRGARLPAGIFPGAERRLQWRPAVHRSPAQSHAEKLGHRGRRFRLGCDDTLLCAAQGAHGAQRP